MRNPNAHTSLVVFFCESGPLRDVQKMALGCVMTTYKWETFDTLDEMVKSRVFSIFGNDCRLNR